MTFTGVMPAVDLVAPRYGLEAGATVIRHGENEQTWGAGFEQENGLCGIRGETWVWCGTVANWTEDPPAPDSFDTTLDSTSGGFPATIEWDIFAEGTWLVLDGGTLDLGVIRDSSHVANNTYCEFSESFYNLAHVGGESVHVTSALKPTGAAADLKAVS